MLRSLPRGRPRFEPLEPGPEIGVGIAYELNRRSEGLGMSTPSLQAETRVDTASPAPLASSTAP